VSEDRRISPALGIVVSIAVAAAMVYFGARLIDTSLWLFENDGPVAASVGLGAVGIVLVVLPLLALVSQLRAWLSRRSAGPR
jgi:hypothetical protein